MARFVPRCADSHLSAAPVAMARFVPRCADSHLSAAPGALVLWDYQSAWGSLRARGLPPTAATSAGRERGRWPHNPSVCRPRRDAPRPRFAAFVVSLKFVCCSRSLWFLGLSVSVGRIECTRPAAYSGNVSQKGARPLAAQPFRLPSASRCAAAAFCGFRGFFEVSLLLSGGAAPRRTPWSRSARDGAVFFMVGAAFGRVGASDDWVPDATIVST